MYILLTVLLLAVFVTVAWKYDMKVKRNKNIYHVLLGYLEEIKAGNRGTSQGICAAYNINSNRGVGVRLPFLNVMEEACKDWPVYSGDKHYPVSSTKCLIPSRAYDIALYSNSMWEGEYGRRRMELLDRMINICLIKSGVKK